MYVGDEVTGSTVSVVKSRSFPVQSALWWWSQTSQHYPEELLAVSQSRQRLVAKPFPLVLCRVQLSDGHRLAVQLPHHLQEESRGSEWFGDWKSTH